jgi:glycosyltransferase involved in cell wall biosynthesis
VINILHLRDTDRVCGPGKTIIETACAASRDAFHHSIGLFLLARETENRYLRAAVDRGVEVVPLESRHQFDPRIIGTILRAVKDHRIDIIHSHDYKSDILAWVVSRVRSIPIMTTIHGWIRNSFKARVYVRSGQMVLSHFDRVVAVSGETRTAILACGVPIDKVVVIHNAIVTANYRPEDQEPGYLRQRFDLPEGARIVGSIGRLSPEKGQRDLLSAAAHVVRARRDVWFVLVGDGPDRQELERQAEREGIADRVRFTGHLTDVRPVFRDLDIMALTSHTEGFPNVVLEALCMQKPVVATDVGGVREIIEDGVTGKLLPPKSPEQIRAGLLAMLDYPHWARELALAGERVVHERFTFERRVAKEEELCRQMLASRKN